MRGNKLSDTERFLISAQDPSEGEPEFLIALFAKLHLAALVRGGENEV